MITAITAKTELKNILKLSYPCRCKACDNSCNYGSGALADEDLKKLAGFLKISEEELKEKYLEEITKFNTTRHRPKLLREPGNPYGKCVFYEQSKGCQVHEAKPLECRIAMSCKPYGEDIIKWFEFNHYLSKKDIESVRQFKIYLESGGKTLQGAELKDIADKKRIKTIEEYDDLKDKTDWKKRMIG